MSEKLEHELQFISYIITFPTLFIILVLGNVLFFGFEAESLVGKM